MAYRWCKDGNRERRRAKGTTCIGCYLLDAENVTKTLEREEWYFRKTSDTSYTTTHISDGIEGNSLHGGHHIKRYNLPHMCFHSCPRLIASLQSSQTRVNKIRNEIFQGRRS